MDVSLIFLTGAGTAVLSQCVVFLFGLYKEKRDFKYALEKAKFAKITESGGKAFSYHWTMVSQLTQLKVMFKTLKTEFEKLDDMSEGIDAVYRNLEVQSQFFVKLQNENLIQSNEIFFYLDIDNHESWENENSSKMIEILMEFYVVTKKIERNTERYDNIPHAGTIEDIERDENTFVKETCGKVNEIVIQIDKNIEYHRGILDKIKDQLPKKKA